MPRTTTGGPDTTLASRRARVLRPCCGGRRARGRRRRRGRCAGAGDQPHGGGARAPGGLPGAGRVGSAGRGPGGAGLREAISDAEAAATAGPGAYILRGQLHIAAHFLPGSRARGPAQGRAGDRRSEAEGFEPAARARPRPRRRPLAASRRRRRRLLPTGRPAVACRPTRTTVPAAHGASLAGRR